MSDTDRRLDCPWRDATDEQLAALGTTREDIRKSYLAPRSPKKLAEELVDLYDTQHNLRKDEDAKYASQQKELEQERKWRKWLVRGFVATWGVLIFVLKWLIPYAIKGMLK